MPERQPTFPLMLSSQLVKRVQAAGPPFWLCENAGQQSPSIRAGGRGFESGPAPTMEQLGRLPTHTRCTPLFNELAHKKGPQPALSLLPSMPHGAPLTTVPLRVGRAGAEICDFCSNFCNENGCSCECTVHAQADAIRRHTQHMNNTLSAAQ